MNIDNRFKTVFAAMMIVSGLVACEKPGPAETAGKKLDEATEKASKSMSDTADKAEKALTLQERETGRVMSDAQITAKVKAALLAEPGLQSLKISVDTTLGVVTLSGFADTKANREKAIKLAESVQDVKSVNSQLLISK